MEADFDGRAMSDMNSFCAGFAVAGGGGKPPLGLWPIHPGDIYAKKKDESRVVPMTQGYSG